MLIFTQVWPVTGCISWMEQGHSHTCTLPSPKEFWTIHGVWPTRFGTVGPAFCNSSATFDVDALRPFEDQLKQFWINIHKGEPTLKMGKATKMSLDPKSLEHSVTFPKDFFVVFFVTV